MSTNLNGALENAIEMLDKSRNLGAWITIPVLVTFTDGADQAKLVPWPEVRKKADAFAGSMYLVFVSGESNNEAEYSEVQQTAGKDGLVEVSATDTAQLSLVISGFAYLAAAPNVPMAFSYTFTAAQYEAENYRSLLKSTISRFSTRLSMM